MQIKNPKLKRAISLDDGTVMTVEVTDKICEAIKRQYNITEIKESHLKTFFEDVLTDAVRKATK